MNREVVGPKLNALIGPIYDTVLNPETWPETLDRIRRHFGFHIAMLGVNSLIESEVEIKVASNVPDEFVRKAANYDVEMLEIWGGPSRMFRLPLEEPIVQSRVVDPATYQNNRFYLEWGRPQGLVDQILLVLESNRTMIASLGFGRHEASPPISESQVEGMRVLAPHLRRAVTIGQFLDKTTKAASSFEAALNASAAAVVLVDRQMRVLHANAKAERMLKAGDGILAPAGRLRLRDELTPGQLDAAVALAQTETEMDRRGMGIPARRRDGSALVVRVMPLERRAQTAQIQSGAAAAIFVAEPSGKINLPMEALSALYGLRPAEARVFQMIALGHSSPEIAQLLGVGANTIKTHTQRLFDKIGRHRRSDLVQLASELSFPD